jgi:LEA14-like dessication related protein
MKKALLVIAIIILIGVVVVAAAGPRQILARLAPQVVDVLYVRTQASTEQAREEVALAIKNNIIPVHVDSLALRVRIEGVPVLASSRKQDLDIDAFTTDTLKLSATIEYDKIYELLKQAEEQGKDSLEVVANGMLYFDAPIMNDVEVPVSQDLTIRAPRLPEIRLDGISVQEVSLPDVSMTATLEVVNREPVAMTIRQLDYELQIDEDEVLVEGSAAHEIHIEANDTSTVEIPVEASLGALDDTIVQFFEEGTDWPVEMYASLRLDTGQKWLNNISMNIQMADTIDVIK